MVHVTSTLRATPIDFDALARRARDRYIARWQEVTCEEHGVAAAYEALGEEPEDGTFTGRFTFCCQALRKAAHAHMGRTLPEEAEGAEARTQSPEPAEGEVEPED